MAKNKPEVKTEINPEEKTNTETRAFVEWGKLKGIEGSAVGASIKWEIKETEQVTEKKFDDAVKRYLNANTF